MKARSTSQIAFLCRVSALTMADARASLNVDRGTRNVARIVFMKQHLHRFTQGADPFEMANDSDSDKVHHANAGEYNIIKTYAL